jgi:hypothetical protein
MSLDGVIREIFTHEDVRVVRINLEHDGRRSNGTLIIAVEDSGPYQVGARFHCHTDREAQQNGGELSGVR